MTSSDTHPLESQGTTRLRNRSLWNLLVEPSDSINELDQRRQARLLATLLVVLLPLTLIGAVTSFLFGTPSGFANPGAYSAGLSALILIVAYSFSRTPRYRVGAAFTVAILAAVPFIVLVLQGTDFLLDGLVWAALPLLLSSILLPIRGTVALIVANLIGFSLMPLVIPGMDYPNTALPMSYIALLGGLILVASRYRSLVEEDRQKALEQANIELESNRQELEHQVAERTSELTRRSAYLEASTEVAR